MSPDDAPDSASSGRPVAAGVPGTRRRLEAVVHGRVQGVGFRYFVLREASALGVDGWVMNLGDGSVRCAAEGPDPALEALLVRIRVGPAGAHVRRLDVAWSPVTGEPPGFRIRSGGHGGD